MHDSLTSCKKEKAHNWTKTIEVSPPAVEEAKDSTSIQISTDGVDVNTKVVQLQLISLLVVTKAK
jgi:hypothetical protein